MRAPTPNPRALPHPPWNPLLSQRAGPVCSTCTCADEGHTGLCLDTRGPWDKEQAHPLCAGQPGSAPCDKRCWPVVAAPSSQLGAAVMRVPVWQHHREQGSGAGSPRGLLLPGAPGRCDRDTVLPGCRAGCERVSKLEPRSCTYLLRDSPGPRQESGQASPDLEVTTESPSVTHTHCGALVRMTPRRLLRPVPRGLSSREGQQPAGQRPRGVRLLRAGES